MSIAPVMATTAPVRAAKAFAKATALSRFSSVKMCIRDSCRTDPAVCVGGHSGRSAAALWADSRASAAAAFGAGPVSYTHLNAVRICMAESLRFLEEGSSAPG